MTSAACVCRVYGRPVAKLPGAARSCPLSGTDVSQARTSGPIISQFTANEGATVWLFLDRDLCRPIQSGAGAHVCND